MRTAGVGKARQSLSALLEEVKKGREILITERGRPVARLSPPRARRSKPLPDLGPLRASVKVLGKPASQMIAEDREDRI